MSKQKLTIFIILGIAVAVAAVKIFMSFNAKPIDPALMRAKGDPKAKVHIIEFFDFQCPACAVGAKKLREYYAAHAADMHIEMKYFPLTGPHKHAMASSLHAECAARQGKFWNMHDLLIDRQAQWSPLISVDGTFLQYAREAGLDEGALRRCLASPETEKEVIQERSLGQTLGVQSTPTYFINNKMVVGVKSLTDELDQYFSSKK